jgi:hypothetical protein
MTRPRSVINGDRLTLILTSRSKDLLSYYSKRGYSVGRLSSTKGTTVILMSLV